MNPTSNPAPRIPRWMPWAAIGALVVSLAACGGLTYWLFLPTTPTAQLRDIFLVLLALEGLLIGLAMLALSVEAGIFLYILYRELMPILESLQETTHTVRGTASFLSDKVTRPVVRAYSFLASVRALTQLLRPQRRRKSSQVSSS